MAKIVTDSMHYTNAATKIREKTGGSQTYKPAEIPDGIEEVYSSGLAAGHEQGYSDGYSLGESAGRQAEYDAFWNKFQENGARRNYNNAFGGIGWNNETFTPKHDIRVNSAYMMFRESAIAGNLGEILDAMGLSFITTASLWNIAYMFSSSKITRLPPLNLSGVTYANLAFASASIVTIDKLTLTDSTALANDTFSGATGLTNMDIEGSIAKNINLQWSALLSHDSIVSVVNALSATETGRTATFSKTAVQNAFETSEGASDGSTSEEWLSLVATKSNWTISLV